MKISTINSILFKGNEPKVEAKPEVKAENKAEVKPNADTKVVAQDKPELKQPLQKDTVEIKKAEPKCEGDACKCTGDNCKKV